MSLADELVKTFTSNRECPLSEEEAMNLVTMQRRLEKRLARMEKMLLAGFVSMFGFIHVTDGSNPITHELMDKIRKVNSTYCSETNPQIRSILIRHAREVIPFYPEGGLCESQQQINKFIQILSPNDK